MSSIRKALADAPSGARRFLRGATADVCLGDLVHGTSLSGRLSDLADRSVLLATRDPLAAALALVELDGVARRLIVCPPDVRAEHWPLLVAKGGVDAIVSDYELDERQPLNVGVRLRCGVALGPAAGGRPDGRATEWVLLTSGTTGAPKMVAHTFAGLTGALDLMFEGWLKSIGIDIKKVPYRNPVEAANDLAAGRVQVYESAYAIARPHIQAGKIKALAVTNTARASAIPDIPTVAEAGFPALTIDGLVGLFGPPAMPMTLRERIAGDIRTIMDDDAVIKDRLITTAQIPNPGGPAEFSKSVDDQRAVLAKSAKELGIQAKE